VRWWKETKGGDRRGGAAALGLSVAGEVFEMTMMTEMKLETGGLRKKFRGW
jgi:hypothetical protein